VLLGLLGITTSAKSLTAVSKTKPLWIDVSAMRKSNNYFGTFKVLYSNPDIEPIVL
jgi:hypothetical protein